MPPYNFMIDFKAWAYEHWWLAFWFAFWAMTFAYGALLVVNRSIIRVLRSIKVLCRGWPPAHIDADGDWKTEPKRPPLETESETRILTRNGHPSVTITRHYREVKA